MAPRSSKKNSRSLRSSSQTGVAADNPSRAWSRSSYDLLSPKNLQDYAATHRLKGCSKLNKEQLIDLFIKATIKYPVNQAGIEDWIINSKPVDVNALKPLQGAQSNKRKPESKDDVATESDQVVLSDDEDEMDDDQRKQLRDSRFKIKMVEQENRLNELKAKGTAASAAASTGNAAGGSVPAVPQAPASTTTAVTFSIEQMLALQTVGMSVPGQASSNVARSSTATAVDTSSSTGTQGNSITQPLFPFAELHKFLPDSVIKSAKKGELIKLNRFLYSEAAMLAQEAERGLTQVELSAVKIGAANRSYNNHIKKEDREIKSASDLINAFGGGLIPAACESNPVRYADYTLFLLQIIALLNLNHGWEFVTNYVEGVRGQKQTNESNYANHRLARYDDDYAIHDKIWLQQTQLQLQKTLALITPQVSLTTGTSNNNRQNNNNNNNNNNSNSNNSNNNNNQLQSPNKAAKVKTECRDFKTGTCKYGDKCKFSHLPTGGGPVVPNVPNQNPS